MLDIRSAGPEDLGAIKVLLAVCLLPSPQVGNEKSTYFVAESERGIIGVCCIERCSDHFAVLRSLGVMPGYRKQQIGRRLVQRALNQAEEQGIEQLYLLTETAIHYFENSGFVVADQKTAPGELKALRLYSQHAPTNARLMCRSLQPESAGHQEPSGARVAARAKAHFDDGYHCAESVLLAAANHAGIHSPLIPMIATGFSHGTAHTWGTCGALNGAILAVNLTHGRSSPDQDATANNQAVRRLIDDFGKSCGSTRCSELMGCDLDTTDGQNVYRNNRQREQCREFVAIGARLAAQLIDTRQMALSKRGASSAVA